MGFFLSQDAQTCHTRKCLTSLHSHDYFFAKYYLNTIV